MSHRPPNDPCGTPDLDPRRPDNRPGLGEIAYRIGTQPEFLQRMKWRIPRQIVVDPDTKSDLLPLAGLRVRETDDPTIALMDSFAATLDVLSFYNERIANEGYLGTAQQRRSMVELVRTIGYEPAPGVAASVALCFTVEASDDPFRSVEIPIGVQAMSVPRAKGELPQIFETVAPIVARAEWNAMPARTQQDQPLALYHDPANMADPDNGKLFLFDLDNSFDTTGIADLRSFTDPDSLTRYYPLSGTLDLVAALTSLIEDHALNAEIDPVLRAVPVDEIYLAGTGLGLRAGARIATVGVRTAEDGTPSVATTVLRVVAAVDDRAYKVTRLVATREGAPPDAVRAVPARRPPRLKRLAMPTTSLTFNSQTVNSVVRRAVWSGPALSALVRSQSWSRIKLMYLIRRARDIDAPATSAAQPGLYVLREDSGFFGCAATRWESMATQAETQGDNPYPSGWDANGGRTVWTDSQGGNLPGNVHVFLEREIKDIVPDSWAAIETADSDIAVFRVAAAATQSRVDYAMTAKTTGLTFREPDGSELTVPDPAGASPLNAFRFRTARIFSASVPLALAGTPIREDITAGAEAIDLESLYLDLVRGQSVSIAGERSDADGLTASETLDVSDVLHVGGHTRLLLKTRPEFSYRRTSVTVNANIAPATHGEAHSEVLGSGDATVPNQRFKLAKPPLTYVSAPTPAGRASTLEIRVDGVAWHEMQTLYEAGPDDRAYEVRHDDDGATWVTFGDGLHGRRLPTGQLNLVASYRAGSGPVGEVADEAIIQLKTRPLGIRSVVNPTRASGSANAESLDLLKRNAPRNVKTLGRIVSLTDYQDFATSFAGVGKAEVAALWSGTRQVVHLSIGGATDAILDASAPVLLNLRDAADLIRDDTRPLEIAPAARRFFQLSARLFGDPDVRAADVEAAARAALLSGFGYDARAIGQRVSAAEVIALLQSVKGVIGVDLDMLALIDGSDPAAAPTTTLASVLPALPARPVSGSSAFAPAELLTLLESGVTLTVEAAHA